MLPLSQDDTINSKSFSRRGSVGSQGHLFHTCSAMPEYLYRIFNYQQMDWNATYYQMVMLCAHPAKVYKSAYYRKRMCSTAAVLHLYEK